LPVFQWRGLVALGRHVRNDFKLAVTMRMVSIFDEYGEGNAFYEDVNSVLA
jgi:hypothetical protein